MEVLKSKMEGGGGAVVQQLERSFLLPRVQSLKPLGDKNFWGFWYEIN